MISTSIGVSMIIAGKILMKKRKKGLKDYIDEAVAEMNYIRKLAEELT
jgi:hypothetical protein